MGQCFRPAKKNSVENHKRSEQLFYLFIYLLGELVQLTIQLSKYAQTKIQRETLNINTKLKTNTMQSV